jgi:hypothetical protein
VELGAYQAGEVTFTTVHARTAIAGDALITAEGRLLQPHSDSLADRVRYLRQAVAYLHGLRGDQRLRA